MEAFKSIAKRDGIADYMEIGSENLFRTGPYLQNLSATEVTVMWITQERSLGWVEYGEGSHLQHKAVAYQDGLVQINNRIHKIKLTGLQPGKSYRYRILSAEIRGGARVDENLPPGIPMAHFQFGKTVVSSVYTFTTPSLDEDTFDMMIFMDLHDQYQGISQLLEGLADHEKGFDLTVFNGDMFRLMESEDQLINHFLQPCVELFAREKPFLFVRGNHELRGAWSRKLLNYFSLSNGKSYHAFSRGPARLVVLDAGEDKVDEHSEHQGLVASDMYREEQREWLAGEIQKKEFIEAPFRIVFIHIPPWHAKKDRHGSSHCRKMFGDLLNEGNVDLLIAGHTHEMGIYEADAKHNFPVLIGGGPHVGERSVIKISVTTSQIRAEMVRDDGRLAGELTLEKLKDSK